MFALLLVILLASGFLFSVQKRFNALQKVVAQLEQRVAELERRALPPS